MTLKKDDIKKLSEQTRIPVKDLTKAIEAEEETPLEFIETQNFTDEELAERDKESGKAGSKSGMEQAVKKGRERLVKEFGDAYNFTGKIMDNLYEAIVEAATDKANTEANRKPNETIEEQKQQLETLRTNLEKIEQEKNTEIENLKADKQKIQDNISV